MPNITERVQSDGWWLGLLPLLAVSALALGWTGLMASDDQAYYLGALQWVEDAPFAGDNHWTTRFPLVLTLAAAIVLLGDGPAALIATSLFWYAAFVASGAALAFRIGGAATAWASSLLFATMPLIATSGSIVNCDLPEATFLMLGAWLLAGRIGEKDVRILPCVGAGLCFGLAVLCRETAVLALSGLGILFLLGRPVPRKALLWAALAAAMLLGGEMAFQAAQTGDTLHRYTLAFNHDDTISRAANEEGNLLVHPAIDPILLLFLNNEFAILFWLAAGAIAAGFYKRLDGLQRRRLALPAAMAAACFVLVALLQTKLVLNPRYFTPVAVVAVIAVACWAARLRPRWRFGLLGAAVASNLLMLSAQNALPRWPAHALAQAAAEHPKQMISAAPEALRRAEIPLRWAGLANATAGEADLLLVKEGAGGAIVASYPSPPTPLGAALVATGLDGLVPRAIRRRLVRPNPTMVLVRRQSKAPVPMGNRGPVV